MEKNLPGESVWVPVESKSDGSKDFRDNPQRDSPPREVEEDSGNKTGTRSREKLLILSGDK